LRFLDFMLASRLFGSGLVSILGISLSVAAPGLAQPGFSESSLAPMVTQMSDALAKKVSTGSCQDLAALVQQIGNTTPTPPDPNALLGQVMITVKGSSTLQNILISKVGPPLINRLLDCNMISVDLLNQLLNSSTR